MVENVRNVAVIGAGISGVCTAAHLLRQGLSVTVYERSSIAGGVWHFDERVSHEQKYPNEVPSRGDFQRVVFEDEDMYQTPPRTPERQSLDLREPTISQLQDSNYAAIAHTSPGPCYINLRNNVSLTAMKTSLGDWPAGLDDFVNQRYLEEYIQQLAQKHNVNDNTRYSTRVEDVSKIGNKWRVCTTTLTPPSHQQLDNSALAFTSPHLEKSTTFFDAVVVASGHYHMPRIPDIPGLKELKAQFPERISHSKGYRNAEKYRGSNVLIVGAGVSSLDIAKEIVAVGGTVYQSSRGGAFDLPATMLPKGAHRVPSIEAFTTTNFHNASSSPSEFNTCLPSTSTLLGHITFTNTTTLPPIHSIILATGYITSYPFLPSHHSDTLPCHLATHSTLVTREGDMVHNLHKDIFFMADPTLSFVGIPYHISTFSLFDFQAQVVARVYSGRSGVQLPSQGEMKTEYAERVVRKGLGREFHSLRGEGAEIEYVAQLVKWVNGMKGKDEDLMVGHTAEWYVAHRIQREILARRFAGQEV